MAVAALAVIKWRWIIGLICSVLAFVVFVGFLVIIPIVVLQQQQSAAQGPLGAVGDIPAEMVAVYQAAAATCPGLDWTILAAIGFTESRHAQSGSGFAPGTMDLNPPLINPQPVSNGEHARGPMQFIPSTWESQKVDGNGDGVMSIDNFPDAAFSAAHMLCSLGAADGDRNPGGGLYRALQSYGGRSYPPKAFAKADEYAAAAAALAAGGGAGGPMAPGAPMPFPPGPVPYEETTTVRSATGAQVRVYTPSAGWWQALFDAAAAEGVQLSGGGWRDSAGQIAARRRNNCPDIYTSPASSCRPPTARPGTSMHERGVAVDFTCNGGGTIGRSGPCYDFLVRRGAEFGLKNLPSEAWHWSANGN